MSAFLQTMSMTLATCFECSRCSDRRILNNAALREQWRVRLVHRLTPFGGRLLFAAPLEGGHQSASLASHWSFNIADRAHRDWVAASNQLAKLSQRDSKPDRK